MSLARTHMRAAMRGLAKQIVDRQTTAALIPASEAETIDTAVIGMYQTRTEQHMAALALEAKRWEQAEAAMAKRDRGEAWNYADVTALYPKGPA